MAIKNPTAIAATGPSGSLVIRKGWLQISGTWTGTCNVQNDVNNDDTWVDATDGAGTVIALTANISCPIDNAAPIKTRVYFTRSTGTANVLLTGE